VTYYPTVDDAIATHARLIARFGGLIGVRDKGALESALARPQSGYYLDLIQEAARAMGEPFAEPPFRGRQQTSRRDGARRVFGTERLQVGV
jgi:hypothetical protein